MRVKRLLAAILSVAMMFSMMSFSVSAEGADVWDGSTSNAWLEDGNPEGTSGDKFYLESAAELAGFAEYVNTYSSTNNLFVGDTVYLCVDVDLNNLEWTPIGTMTSDKRHFYGSFDGQNHTISNLKISEESGQIYGGLFGRFKGTSFSQTFSNLTLHNVDIAAVAATDPSKAGAGALMGYGYDQIIDNVHVTGNISISGDSCVGGIAGQSRANISNSSVEASGTVSGSYRVGGLVGWFISASANGYNAEINDCFVKGDETEGFTVKGETTNVGGLVGRVNDNNGTVAIDDVAVYNASVSSDNNSVAYVVPGFTATNTTVSNVTTTVAGEPSVPSDVAAKIGDKEYLSLYTAISEADGETVELLKNVTIADWQMIEDKSFSLNGNNHTITISSVTQNTLDNGGALIRNTTADELNLSDVTFVLPERAVVAYTVGGTMDNVTVNGGRFGFAVNAATNFFGCTFNGQAQEALYFQDVTGAPGSVVDGCTFNLENARVGALWSDEVFTNNVINYEGDAITGLTILSNSSATVSGNVMSEDTNLEIYVPSDEQGSFTLSENNIAGGVFVDGADVSEQFANVTIESNTLSDEALAGLQAIKNGIVSVDPVATVNGKDFYSIQDAVDNAADGATITILENVELSEIAYESPKNPYQFKGYYGVMIPDDKAVVIDLNGKSISYKDTYGGCDSSAVYNIGELTITDSSADKTGKISYVDVADNVTYNQNHAVIFNVGVLTVEDGTIEHLDTGNGTVSDAIDNNSNIGYNYGNDVICTINGGTLIGAEYRAIRQYTHYNEGVDNRVEINDGTIMGGIYMQHGDSWYYAKPESNRLNVNCELEINGGTITTLDDGYGHIRSYLNNPDNEEWSIVINGGTIEVPVQIQVQKGYRYSEDGMAASGTLITGEATGTRNTEWLEENGGFISGGTFTDMGDLNDVTTNLQSFLADGYKLQRTGAGIYSVLEGESEDDKLTADTISIEYKDVTVEGTEGEKTYEIVVKANGDDMINELASVDLSFVYTTAPVTGGSIDFTVAPATDFTMTRHENTNRYMFNYNGVTAVEGTANAIPVGTITVTGYGSFTIATADADTNIVNATTVNDNLVDSYTAEGATDDDSTTGGLLINTDSDTTDDMYGEIKGDDAVIAVPTRTLTINLDFPNAVEDNTKAYQDMKVEITGNIDGVNKTVVYNLGEDEVAMTNGDYVVVEDALVLNNAYTVTVSGAGYRTARYTVTMTDDKQLNFWNNVMDEAQVVELGKDSSVAKVTFLAGDIVKDNNINIYDLSAVVSYFGTETNTAAYDAYAKYDLNRDGVIDSKDVAYVLVSWNN